MELEALNSKLHKTEEHIRRRKRKINDLENVVNDSGYQAKKTKDDRAPNISSEVLSMNSEKLNLSGSSFSDAERRPWLHLGQSILALEPQKSYRKTTNHCSMVCGQH
ncbi:uncharacterized protein LOC141894113 [Acropora palmata]|uniref:uncharacterized protein LOC141894113 n=1 Tax=Acropora palmata TaxID=6131 RepID=UPI003DA0E884